MMIRVLHHSLGDQRWRAHPFKRCDTARAFLRTVHTAGVELHHAVGVRQTTVADAGVFRIALVNVDARDQRIKHVRPTRQKSERLLHACPIAAVLEPVAVA